MLRKADSSVRASNSTVNLTRLELVRMIGNSKRVKEQLKNLVN